MRESAGQPDSALPDDRDARLQAYLDGELPQDEAAALEADLESDVSLRGELDSLRAADSWLRREFAGEVGAEAPPLPDADSIPGGNPIPFGLPPQLVAMAAAIAVIVGGFLGYQAVTAPATFNGQDAYNLAAASFTPDVICDTPEKFRDYTSKTLGVTIDADFTAPVALIGWTGVDGRYIEAGNVAPRVLLAESAGGERIITIFVRDDQPRPALRGDATINRFTRTIDGVRVYELTPLDEPVVLGVLSAE
ncbi:MAG: hypothetical protein AAFR38_01230 [Planctomycetota bacterium]